MSNISYIIKFILVNLIALTFHTIRGWLIGSYWLITNTIKLHCRIAKSSTKGVFYYIYLIFAPLLAVGMIASGVSNLLTSMELDTTKLAMAGKSYQTNLQAGKISELESIVATYNKQQVEVAKQLEPISKKDIAIANINTSIPKKWQAHIKYVSNKIKTDDQYKKAINGYTFTQNKYGFYTKTNCHKFLLGAIHYREHGYTIDNAWNGQGMYQNLNNNYPLVNGLPSITNNATEQSQQACDFLKNKAKQHCSSVGTPEELSNLDNIELLGCVLAKYNGCMSKHYNSCGYTVKGLSESQENFMKCGADFTCPMVPEKQLGALTVILSLMITQQ